MFSCTIQKHWILSLLLLLYPHNGLSTSFALVHLGAELPPYLIYALQQIRLFNTTKPIYVLANTEALNKRPSSYDQLNVHYIPVESVPKSQEHRAFLQATLRKKNISSGFWVVTSERLLVLYDWMKYFNKKQIIHLENDTLLYTDINELMPIFKKQYPGLAIVMDEDERCIPCFMYIANQNIMQKLASFFVKEIKTKPATEIWHLNDMLVLASFFRTHGKQDVDNLPIIMPSYVKTYGLHNQLGKIPQNPQSYCNNINLFHSIFDGAALGQYLGGTPHGHLPGFVNETTIFDPSKLQFTWKTDIQGRSVPYIRCKGAYFRVNNLHIHSKKLWEFISKQGPLNLEQQLLYNNQTTAT